MRYTSRLGIILACVTVLAVAGCAGRQAGSPAGPSDRSPSGPVASAPVNDPELSYAAERVDRLVHQRYTRWYAGLVVDHQSRTMTIYRKPGSDLDGTVRAEVAGVTVAFADAQLSEEEMLALVRRVIADTSYWRGQGITVNGAGPRPDGSAVTVMTGAGTDAESATMSRHYGSPIVAVLGAATPATAGQYPLSTTPGGGPS